MIKGNNKCSRYNYDTITAGIEPVSVNKEGLSYVSIRYHYIIMV